MTVRYDFVEIKASVAPDTGWISDNPIVTRSGIFKYRMPDGTVRNEFRPETEVFNTDSLATYRGVPITDGHNGIINKDNPKGIIGTVISPGTKDGDNVRAELIIHDPNKLGQRKELSCGYTCDLDSLPGEHNGQRYDCSQRNIRINHLAVVVKGRAGNAKLRLDADDGVSGDFEQENNDMADNNSKLVTVRLDNIDYPAAPEVMNALGKRQELLDTLQKKYDSIEAERDTLKAAADKHKEEIEKAKEAGKEEMKIRSQVESVAKQYDLKLDEDDTLTDVQKKLLAKLRPTLKLDGKSDEYITSAFDLTIEAEKEKNKKVSGQIEKTVTKDDSNDGNKVVSAEGARAKMIEKLRGQHYQQKTA